jgi:hypothetical protein
MDLSPKAVRFVIAALEHYERYHDERLHEEGLSDDDASDLVNDRQYLDAVKQSFQEYHAALLRDPERVRAQR